MLPVVTSNTADILKLGGKGRVAPGADADLLVLERATLAVVDVPAGGRRLVKVGAVACAEPWEKGCRRTGLAGG